LFDRLGHVVKAEWSSRFGEGDDEDQEQKPDAASVREANEAARGSRQRPSGQKAAPVRASATRAAVTDVMSAWRMLELEAGATLDEVRAAYRTLAQRYHPRTLSKVPDQAYAAQTVLDALTEALEVLEV